MSMICSNRQQRRSARRDAPSIRPREKQLRSEPTAVVVGLTLLHLLKRLPAMVKSEPTVLAVALVPLHLLKRLPAMVGRFYLLGELYKEFQGIYP